MGTKSLLVAAALISTQAFAGISSNISMNSDYIFRGVTQNGHKAAIQGGVDWDSGFGLSAGTWVSQADTVKADGTAISDIESDFYASYSYELTKDIAVSAGGVYYHYLYNGFASMPEFNVGVTAWGTKVTANYGTEYVGLDTSYWYFSAARNFVLSDKDKLELALSVGYTVYDKTLYDSATEISTKKYLDYRVALEKKVDALKFSLAYSDTNRKGVADAKIEDKALVVGVTRTF